MKTAAIIAEYNPFHSGHKYHIEQTLAAGATHIVAIMSGNFVQRGEPAVFDKFIRSQAALAGGADLVLELPLPWTMGGAQTFARGAVGIADALGCVDLLSFGCECGNVAKLRDIACACRSDELNKKTADYLSLGITFAAARQKAVADMLGENSALLLEKPNNNLAIEYLSCLNLMNSRIEPVGIERIGGYNDMDTTGDFASAAAIRKIIAAGGNTEQFIPDDIQPLYTGNHADAKLLETAVLCTLRRLTKEQIALAPDISEGLENRIYSAIREACSVEDLLSSIKTKRYTLARIRRIIMSLFLGVKAAHSEGIPPYIRILACNEKGREILAEASPKLPVVGRASQLKSLEGRAGEIFALECEADDIFALCFSPARECGADYTYKIY